MKKIMAILLSCILGATLFVGCGENSTNNGSDSQKKESISNGSQKQENKKEEPKTVNLKDTNLYKEMDTVMPFKIIELSGTKDTSDKSLYVDFEVKKGSAENEVKEFYQDCNLVASYISTKTKNEGYKDIVFSNKQLGAIAMYSQDESVDNFITLQTASFAKEEYQKIFDKLKGQ